MDSLYFGSGEFIPFSEVGIYSHHSFLFDGTEVPFPNLPKNY